MVGIILCGCSPIISKLITSQNNIRIPQVTAHLEPVFKRSKINLSGRIIVNNPTHSAIELENIFLAIKDNEGNLLAESFLRWSKERLESGDYIDADVDISLDLSVLDKEYISVFLKTGFVYNQLKMRIPLEDEVAVLYLTALRESIKKPLEVSIFTKFYLDLSGEVNVKYVLGITNPIAVDLELDDGLIQVYTDIVSGGMNDLIPSTLFRAAEKTEVEGVIRLQKMFGVSVARQFISERPVNIEVSGKLKIPRTEVFMPFHVKSIQQLDFSLFKERP